MKGFYLNALIIKLNYFKSLELKGYNNNNEEIVTVLK